MKIDVSSVSCPSKIPIHLIGEYLCAMITKQLYQLSGLIKQILLNRIIRGQRRKEPYELSWSLVHLPLNICVMPLSVGRLKAVFVLHICN